MKKFVSLLFYIWELPQNLLGLLIYLFVGVKGSLYKIEVKRGNSSFKRFLFVWKYKTAVSLGSYIALSPNILFHNEAITYHEIGHTFQSRKWGWLYLIAVGIPSLRVNITCRILRKKIEQKKLSNKWQKRIGNDGSDLSVWAYNQYPEKQANNHVFYKWFYSPPACSILPGFWKVEKLPQEKFMNYRKLWGGRLI